MRLIYCLLLTVFLLACSLFKPSVKSPADGWWCLGGDIEGVPVGGYLCFDTEAKMLTEKSRLEQGGKVIAIAARPAQ